MALDIEEGIEVADVYAEALFELAAEAGTLDEVHSELEELVRLQEAEPGFSAFVTSTAVDDDDREESLEKIFRGRLSDVVLNTLQVMNQHGRSALLQPLLRAYTLRLEDSRGQVEVVATSAVELDAGEKAEVERVAQVLSGKKPLVKYMLDPAVIGGLVLRVDDRRFDNSIRQHLWAARTRLLERSTRGMELNGE